MSVIKRSFSILTSVLLLAGPVLAQNNAAGQRGEAGPAVAVSSTAAGVRFVAPGDARRVRLEVYTAAGERLFDSGFRAGGIYNWDGQGLQDGSYLCVLTAEDLEGQSSRRLSSVTIAGGRAALGKEAEEQLKLSYAQAISAAGLGQDEPTAAARAKKSNALTVTAHDGTDGQVTATAGALTFRTGDVFTGQEQEQMRVTPEGRVGIGTNAPEDTLDVAGTIRARGGIRFDDGTVLTSANGLGSKTSVFSSTTSVTAGDTPTINIAGTGTSNKLAKWLDGTGTLGDSVLTEVNGNIGVGTSTPGSPFTVTSNTNVSPLAIEGAHPIVMGFAIENKNAGSKRWAFQVTGSQHPQGIPKGSFIFRQGTDDINPMVLAANGNAGFGVNVPGQRVDVAGNVRVNGTGNGIIFPDGTKQTTAGNGGAGSMTGTAIVSAINDAATAGVISEARVSPNLAKLGGQNYWTGQNTFNGVSMNGTNIVNVANPVSATDATNKAYVDANFIKFVPAAEQLSVGDANGTAPMINLRGGSTCCSGPGGHTPAFFKVFQNGSFVATGNLGIGTSPMEGKGYRTSWHTYKGAFRSGYADNEWDDANVGFFSWAGGSNSTARGLYALAFGDTNSAESTSSIVFGSGNQVKGAAGF